MKTAHCTLALVAALLAPRVSQATTYAFTPLNFPGMSSTAPSGIDEYGVIVGTAGGSGFTYSGGSFASYSTVYDIAVVSVDQTKEAGTVFNSPSESDRFQAYTSIGGKTSYYGDASESGTFGTSINDAGFATGYAIQGSAHGLIIPPPGDPNSPNQVVLNFPTATGLDSYDGTFAYGINDSGLVVGYYTGGADHVGNGFLYQNGAYTTFDVPGALDTRILGVDDAGDLVGSVYTSTPGEQGFVYQNGVATIVSYPGELYSYVTGISPTGEITGVYTDDGDPKLTLHGYTAVPVADTPTDVPEPASLGVLGVGVAAAALASRRARRRSGRDA